MAQSTLVTVIIPLFNHARYIEVALNSVIAQTHRNIEVILIDDQSSDDGYDLAQANLYAHQDRFDRIVAIRNNMNRGAVFSLNRGISLARGKVVTFLNSDDMFEATRLSKMLSQMETDGRSWAFSRISPMNEVGAPAWNQSEAHRFSVEPAQLCQALPSPSWALLHFQAAISTGNIVVDRNLALKVGGFLPLSYCHDWAFALACAWHCEPSFVDAQLYRYRFHTSNSFSRLSHVGDADTAAVLRAHCVRAARGNAPNSQYPTSQFGSTLYAEITKDLGIDGLHNDMFRPYRNYHRTIYS